jgi:hypothetical protein
VAGNLATDLEAIRDSYLRKLNELHDDYVHTRTLWRSVQVRVQRHKRKLRIQNPITGSTIDGGQLAGKARDSVQRLKNRSFKEIVTQFELFVGEVLRVWLPSHPELITEKALNVGTLLASRTLAEAQHAAIQEAVESTVADKMYGRPDRWFNYLRKLFAVQVDAANELSFVEMKARRDVLEHNDGIVEATYREKAKGAVKYNVGDRVQLSDQDVNDAFQRTGNLIRQVADSAVAKS